MNKAKPCLALCNCFSGDLESHFIDTRSFTKDPTIFFNKI